VFGNTLLCNYSVPVRLEISKVYNVRNVEKKGLLYTGIKLFFRRFVPNSPPQSHTMFSKTIRLHGLKTRLLLNFCFDFLFTGPKAFWTNSISLCQRCFAIENTKKENAEIYTAVATFKYSHPSRYTTNL
jgi:hypothetical protein